MIDSHVIYKQNNQILKSAVKQLHTGILDNYGVSDNNIVGIVLSERSGSVHNFPLVLKEKVIFPTNKERWSSCIVYSIWCYIIEEIKKPLLVPVLPRF